MNIGKYIYAKLIASTPVTALVSTRIYPVLIGEKVSFPAIAYMVETLPKDKQKTQASGYDTETVTFHFWSDIQQGADGYNKIGQIDAAIRQVFDFTSGTLGGITVEHGYFVSSKDIFNEDRMLIGKEAIYTFITKN
jgi:hypothetical protein